MKKKILKLTTVILGIITITACFTACGANNGITKNKSAVSMFDLRKSMEESVKDNLPEMLYTSDSDDDAEENFTFFSDIDYSLVNKYFLSYSKEGKADEIAVIAVKNEKDAEAAKQSLEEHMKSRQDLFEEYDAKEASRIEKNGIVFTQNQYAVLIICDNAHAARRAFENFINK